MFKFVLKPTDGNNAKCCVFKQEYWFLVSLRCIEEKSEENGDNWSCLREKCIYTSIRAITVHVFKVVFFFTILLVPYAQVPKKSSHFLLQHMQNIDEQKIRA